METKKKSKENELGPFQGFQKTCKIVKKLRWLQLKNDTIEQIEFASPEFKKKKDDEGSYFGLS